MQKTDDFFYEAEKKTRITVEGVNQEQKGVTLDGDPIYHTTYIRTGKHVSYDTVLYRGEHYYILGSGHETIHGGSISRWERYTNEVTWRQAQHKRTCQVINC